MSLDQIENLVLDEVFRFYVNLRIPTKTNTTLKKKIHDLIGEFKNVKKIYGRTRPPYSSEVEKVNRLEQELDNLFDMSQPHPLIEDEESQNFIGESENTW